MESIVSELMEIIQKHLTESVGEDPSTKEQRAVATGKKFEEMATFKVKFLGKRDYRIRLAA